MGTLSSELGPHVDRLTRQPRLYADANVPAGVVAHMRQRLRWDVFFVMEHDELRRARDTVHYQLARQLRRTLLTLDRDYFDDRRFPPEQSGGVIVVTASDERAFIKVLARLDAHLFRASSAPPDEEPPSEDAPLAGRKLHADIGWPGEHHSP